MTPPLVFHPKVEPEVDQAYRWYESQKPGLGTDFLSAVETSLERIRRAPDLHAPIYKGVRRVLVRRFPYAILYRTQPDRIEIVAIHHCHRNPDEWQSRV